MPEKYDLAKMLEEIKEDEELDTKKSRQLSQEEIEKMIIRKQKERNVKQH